MKSSSKISSNPDVFGTSPRPAFSATTRRERHASLPSNQSTLSSCSDNKFGTSSGSRIFANETRAGANDFDFDAAKIPPDVNARLPPGLSRYMPDLWVFKICEGREYRIRRVSVQPALYT